MTAPTVSAARLTDEQLNDAADYIADEIAMSVSSDATPNQRAHAVVTLEVAKLDVCIAALRELSSARQGMEKVAADWHQASMEACRLRDEISRLRGAILGDIGADVLLVSNEQLIERAAATRQALEEAREIARRLAVHDRTEADLRAVASWPSPEGRAR